MKGLGLQPDSITMNTVMEALEKGGQGHRALELLGSMPFLD